jgi:hypothetical protein
VLQPADACLQNFLTSFLIAGVGTGKTTLTDKLPRRVGFLAISPALASAEVNRSLVGETEELLKQLLCRAHKFPHLLCSIAVDEIDGLAPKRDDKSSQSKNDSLSMLLSLVGGIKDVKNLVFMASTNRLKMMDQAFLRRMNAQFFVGRPNPDARRRILDRINPELGKRAASVRIHPVDLNNLVTWTTNFSGAALDILVSDLIVYATRYLKRGETKIEDRDFLRFAHKVSEQFSLSIGSSSFASIFNDILHSPKKKQIQNIFETNEIPINLHELYTGLIVADLSCGRIILETKSGEYNEAREGGPMSMKELLYVLVKFTTALNLDSIQMFDMDMLLGNAAYDDSKAAEIIQEKIDECTKYAKAIAIVDLDSIVGLTDSESSSSMGLSSSYSIANMRMFSLMMNILEKKNISSTESATAQPVASALVASDGMRNPLRLDSPNEGSTTNNQMWVVAVTAKDFMLKALRREKQIKMTEAEQQEQKEMDEKENASPRCNLCLQDYLERDNDKFQCNYHCGYLFHPGQDSSLWRPVHPFEVYVEARKINEKGFADEISKFKYLCCLNPYGHQGCRKGNHKCDEQALKSVLEKNYRSNLEKIELIAGRK